MIVLFKYITIAVALPFACASILIDFILTLIMWDLKFLDGGNTAILNLLTKGK